LNVDLSGLEFMLLPTGHSGQRRLQKFEVSMEMKCG